MLYVVADPELFEIEEMLDIVGRAHDLDDILPKLDSMSRAEFLKMGWCYLWYDADTLEPIGYTAFVFYDAKTPEFMFGATAFARPRHVLAAARAMLRVMRVSLKNKVRVYIDNERIAKLAAICGFRRARKHDKNYKNIWIRGRVWAKDRAM